MREFAAVTLIVLAGAALTAALVYEMPWASGLVMVLVGVAVALMFWGRPQPDASQPLYGSPEALAEEARRRAEFRARFVPKAPTEGLGVVLVLILGAAVAMAAMVYEFHWLTGLAMLAVGLVVAVMFRRRPKAKA